MTEHTGYRYRLCPTPQQERALRRWAGCARTVWNVALEQRRTAWRMGRQRASWAAQDAELGELKRAFSWLREPHSDVLQQVLRDLDRGFRNFFVGRARYPRFRRKGGSDRFRIQNRPGKGEIELRRVSARWGEVRVPKLGWVRFRWSRRPLGQIKHLTVSRNALGWHVSFCMERQVDAPPRHSGPPVGIDLGIAATVALSSGELCTIPGLAPGQVERLRRLARRAGRQETARRRRPPGNRCRSRRHQRTLEQIAKLKAHEARIRRDFLHKRSTEITNNHGVVYMERLRVTEMTRSARGTPEAPGANVRQKSGLNRAVLAQGWGELRVMLAYKMARRGGRLIEVASAYTSQRCPRCGAIDARSRRNQADFVCTTCGHTANADVNAARNILAAGLGRDSARSPLERHGHEARTTWQEAAAHAV